MHDRPFDLDELKAELDEYGFVVLHNRNPSEQIEHNIQDLEDF